MGNEMKKCCICGKMFEEWGNNPWPVNNEVGTTCCDECNMNVVLLARIRQINVKTKRSEFTCPEH